MKLLYLFIIFILAFLAGMSMIRRIYYVSFRYRLFDKADSRKVHQGNIPRLGGVMFFPVQCGIFMLVILILRYFEIIPIDQALLSRFIALICGMGILYILGVVDDLAGIGFRWKFVFQFAAVSGFVVGGLWIDNMDGLFGIAHLPAWAGIPLTLIMSVCIINAFNLIDGIDGLCSGLAMLGCTVLGMLFLMQGAWWHAIFSFITVGVLSPFFYCNMFGRTKRQRRIFMGDTGSTTLGMTIAFLIVSYIEGFPRPGMPGGNIVVAFSVALIPLLDLPRVMWIRWRAHKPLFLPDRNHIHHYFLGLGYSKHRTLFYILLISLLLITNSVLFSRFAGSNPALLSDLALWFACLWWFGKKKKEELS